MPTTADLKTAFTHCGLWRQGWTYERAINTPAVAIALNATALAQQKKQQQSGAPAPAPEQLGFTDI